MKRKIAIAVTVISLSLIAVTVISLSLPGVARAEDLTVTGKVIDAAGKPVTQVELASFWISREGSMQAYESTKSDESGRFALKMRYWGGSLAVLALDKECKTGGIVSVQRSPSPLARVLGNLGLSVKQSAVKDLTVKLEALVRVKGNFFCKELNQKPSWTNVYIMTADGARILQCDSREATFTFLLPAGKYKFLGYGSDIKDIRQDLIVPADKSELDLQTLEVPATVIAKHKGKTPPPWHVTDARGVKKEVTLADYKGKWVLVEFWGFW